MNEVLKKDVLKKGLSEEQVTQSKEKFGTNELAKKEQESLWSMFVGAFDDIWIKVLCGALALKVALALLGMMIPAIAGENDVVEIISIILAIGLATGFSTLSEYRNTSRSEALQEEYNKKNTKLTDEAVLETLDAAGAPSSREAVSVAAEKAGKTRTGIVVKGLHDL